MTLFVDTSAFFALANLADKHHAEAVAAYQANVGDDDLQTSDHVIIETWYLLRSRLGRRAAMAFWAMAALALAGTALSMPLAMRAARAAPQ